LTAELAASFKLDQPVGALVASVAPKSPAAVAGLRPGDVIQRYDGKPVVNAGDLPPRVAATRPGHEAAIEVWREGRKQQMNVTVATLPQQPAAR
ncbi:MAG: PDZ domain-containing protein, partial [Thiobacillus sp.]|nr:PDZ domain-containing protein [Thiobacillus sp.]